VNKAIHTSVKGLIATGLLLFASIVHAQEDLTLWYEKPAVKWTDALPIGNGRLGAMIFGGVDKDRIQFNEETLWTGGPREYSRPGAYRYLDSIRQLLSAGKQKEAEQLAEKEFMGLKSGEGDRGSWREKVLASASANGFSSASFNDNNWKRMQVPSYEGWEAAGFEGLDGAVWLRSSFNVDASMTGKDYVLDLNRIRDADFTYVNGKLVGSMESTEPRKYTIPKDLLKAGNNTIAVLVLNYVDKGGIAGYKDTSRHIGFYIQGEPAPRIDLGGQWKYFVVDDNPPPTPRYQADYQPFGDLYISTSTSGNIVGYTRSLDLQSAVAKTVYTINGVRYERQYLASHPAGVIAVRLTASEKGKISFTAALESPHKNYHLQQLDANTVSMSVAVKNGALKGMAMLKIFSVSGRLTVRDNRIEVTGADEATLYLSAATNFKSYNDVSADDSARCMSLIAPLQSASFASLKAAHIKEYRSYFDRFRISLTGNKKNLSTDERLRQFAAGGDPSFIALYMQYGRYLLISSSRPGTQPANLQGIWNELLSPPWGSKYTTNINAEMNYWPAELLNLSSLHQPLFSMIGDLAVTGSKTAKDHYNAPGWVLHHNTDLWRGTAPINAANHGIWVGGSGWLSYHLWEHYLFTQDAVFLRKTAYPIMKEAARFYNSFLSKDPKTGWLISSPSNSPEQGGLVAGPSMDHQIIRALFKAVISASSILKTDKKFSDSLATTLARMAPDQVGKYGQLQEWLEDKDSPDNKHRHVSHLWAVFPGKEINWDENDTLMKAARQSLIYRGDAATGWSIGWKMNLWARFRDGDHAYKLVEMLLTPADKGGAGSYTNLFDAHPPFQIDGNFGGAAGVAEMLVQSHLGYIHLLPALPSAMPSGEVSGLCARGGFVIKMKWQNGKLLTTDILSLSGNTCIVRYGDQTKRFATVKGKTYRLNQNLVLTK